MKVSVKEISEKTGYSPATVSNALNHKKGVNKDTAEKIFQAARELGYGEGEKISKIRFVVYRKNGKILDENQFHPMVMEGVQKQAKDWGYDTVFSHLDCSSAFFQEQLEEILYDASAAVILLGTEMMEEDFLLFREHKCHLILLDGWSDTVLFDSVLISNTDSALSAVNYLIGKGHKEIGYIQGDFRIQAFKYREIGYRRAMHWSGLEINENFTAAVGTKIETAYADMKQYLDKAERLPTAFFADNDVIAIGAMRAIKEKGLRVPEDISLVGFDDLPFGAIANPGLTTIHVLRQEMGELAVRRLLEIVKGDIKAKTKIQVCTEFVERESVKEIT